MKVKRSAGSNLRTKEELDERMRQWADMVQQVEGMVDVHSDLHLRIVEGKLESSGMHHVMKDYEKLDETDRLEEDSC
jgi:hypothetical protein